MERVGNLHVKDYLDYYINLKTSPGFAVLIKGEWGAGKSWFIREVIGDHEAMGVKFLYVSLYGITDYRGIEDAFYQKIHPFLSSKGAKIFGKVVKAIAKATVRVDWDGDKQEDLRVSPVIPDIEIQEYLQKVDSSVLVFDDLERCGIPLPNILGYINQFVENNDAKVIILANENQIYKREVEENHSGKIDSYANIKEKVVGRTFEIQPDFDGALASFQKSIVDTEIANEIGSKATLIQSIFRQAGYNNLRHLKYTILDFTRFYGFLPKSAFEKSDLIDHIISLFFAISFELKKGAIKEEELGLLFSFDLMMASRISKEETQYTKIQNKYPVFKEYAPPVSSATWKEYFIDGTLDSDHLEKSILNSAYYQEERTPSWVKFHRFFNLNDDQFHLLYNELYEDYSKFRIEDLGVIVHLTGIFMWCSDLNLIPKSKKQILNLGRRYITYLKKEGMLRSQFKGFPGYDYAGLRYHGLEFPEFKSFLTDLKSKVTSSTVGNYPKAARILLNNITENIGLFCEKIVLTNSPNNLFFEVPILKFINPTEFVAAVLKIGTLEKKELAEYLEERYKHPELAIKLLDELNWLKKVDNLLAKERIKLKTEVSGLTIEQFVQKAVKSGINSLTLLKPKTA